MKNFVAIDDPVTVPAPTGGAVSGTGYLIGQLFGVSKLTAAAGLPIPLVRKGIVDLPKAATITPAVGVLLYWDDAAKNVTSTAGSNKKIGVAIDTVAAAGDATIRVLLIPSI